MEFSEVRGLYDLVPVEVLSVGPPLMVRLKHARVERHPARMFETEGDAQEEIERWNEWLAGPRTLPRVSLKARTAGSPRARPIENLCR